MNHLIEWTLQAIQDWPPLYYWARDNNEVKLWAKEHKKALYKVLAHYENGGNIQNRP